MKKYLRKNEIRSDLNPEYLNRFGYPHDAVITAKRGHKYKANTKTHSQFVNGVESLDLQPDLPDNVQHKRISPPFWQSEKLFGPKQNKKVDKRTLYKIKKYNKNFYK